MSYLNQQARICEIAKGREKMKMPKFEKKNALFGYFGLRFKKTIVTFETSTPKFVYLQNFGKKQNA